MSEKINKHYVSEEDQFLDGLRQKFPESASQEAERLKHAAIAERRDNAIDAEDDKGLWDKF